MDLTPKNSGLFSEDHRPNVYEPRSHRRGFLTVIPCLVGLECARLLSLAQETGSKYDRREEHTGLCIRFCFYCRHSVVGFPGSLRTHRCYGVSPGEYSN
jgi:hypothetical protein